MKVAGALIPASPMLGQRALSQTVVQAKLVRQNFSSWKFSAAGPVLSANRGVSDVT